MCNEYAVYSLITNDYFVWIHKNEIKEIFIKKTYGSTGSANTEGSINGGIRHDTLPKLRPFIDP